MGVRVGAEGEGGGVGDKVVVNLEESGGWEYGSGGGPRCIGGGGLCREALNRRRRETHKRSETEVGPERPASAAGQSLADENVVDSR